MPLFQRQTRQGLLTAEYDNGLVLYLGGSQVAQGCPAPMPAHMLQAIRAKGAPRDMTHRLDKYTLTAREVEAYEAAHQAAHEEARTASLQGRMETLAAEIADLRAQIDPAEFGPHEKRQHARLKALEVELIALEEEHPREALRIQAEAQRAAAHWSDPVGRWAAAKACLRILDEGGSMEEARAALEELKEEAAHAGP